MNSHNWHPRTIQTRYSTPEPTKSCFPPVWQPHLPSHPRHVSLISLYALVSVPSAPVDDPWAQRKLFSSDVAATSALSSSSPVSLISLYALVSVPSAPAGEPQTTESLRVHTSIEREALVGAREEQCSNEARRGRDAAVTMKKQETKKCRLLRRHGWKMHSSGTSSRSSSSLGGRELASGGTACRAKRVHRERDRQEGERERWTLLNFETSCHW